MDIIQAIKVKLVAQRPYYATAVFALRCVPRPGLGTMAVDKFGRVYYDPDKVGAGKDWGLSLATPVIVKYRDEKTDARTELERWIR